jgi:ABC-type antimicrobial peptide transport system permease subunit
VRTEGAPYALTGAVQERLGGLAPGQPLGAFTTVEEHVAHQLSAPLLIARILYGVGLLALALSAMGIYGVMSFSVARQTGEIGLRMALGALPRQILARVTWEGARMASLGFLLGIPAALGIRRLIQGFFETSAQDFGADINTGIALLPVVEVLTLLLAVGLLACYLPARHATRIDPAEALESR